MAGPSRFRSPMLALFVQASLAFSLPQSLPSQTSSRAPNRCAQPHCTQPLKLTRRALSVSLPLLVAAPSAHAAAVSPQAVQKSRAIYGSRVFRLQKASPDFILEEKNAFTLFISGCYSTTADKPTRIQLEKLEKTALAAAKKGDAAGAQAAVKEFVQLASIKEYDTVPGNVFNQKNACDRQGLQCGYGYEGYIGSRNKD